MPTKMRKLGILLSCFMIVAGCGDGGGGGDAATGDAARDDAGREAGTDAAAEDGGLDAGSDGGSADGGGGDGGGADGGGDGPVVTVDRGCNRGPFDRTIDVEGPDCSSEPAPMCPAAPSEGARPEILLASCSFGMAETDCVPVFDSDCPWDSTTAPGALHLTLVNPNPGAGFGCWGDLTLTPTFGADESFRMEYEAVEFDESCEPTGETTGVEVLENNCCEAVIDIYFPRGMFTFRLQLQSDWAP